MCADVVSIVMPVYNTKIEYLRIAVDSVLKQSYAELEFLIVNDGSNVEVVEFLNSIKDSRVVLINNEKNIGISRSLNLGIRKATGKFIARFDSDDIMLHCRIDKQINELKKNKDLSFVGSWFNKIDHDGKFIKLVKLPTSSIGVDFSIAFKQDPAIGHPMVLFRSSVFDEIEYSEYFAKMRCEDYDLFLRLRALGHRYKNLNIALTDYRVHLQQVSNIRNADSLNISYSNFVKTLLQRKDTNYPVSKHANRFVKFYESAKIYNCLRRM